MSLQEFKDRFRFNADKAGLVGIEREAFLADRTRTIVPQASSVLALWQKGADNGHYIEGEFGYELSACQIESHSGPCRTRELEERLDATERRLNWVLAACGLQLLHTEVGPDDMPLDVFPDPEGRYARITKGMPRHVLLAACQVIGTHVHVGMPDHETALRVYNRVIPHCDELCAVGDGSSGRRLEIYRHVTPDADPKPYESWEEYYRIAQEKGFAEDPRRFWSLIRISVHGTIEFRMFGATASVSKVVDWADYCHTLCDRALL